jgi:hypothetical protein
MRTLGNIYIESSQRKIGLQLARFGLYEAGRINRKKKTRANTITVSAP